MATGTVTVFNEFGLDLGNEIHDLDADTLKLAIIKNTQPAFDETLATPTYSDFSANEIAAGSTYSTGGVTLTSVTWALVSGYATLGAADVNVAQDGTGATNCRWGLVYNSSAGSGQAICYVDFGSTLSLQDGPIDIEWNNGYILRLPQAA